MFPGTVGDAVAAAGIPPQLLELELTESILLEHSEDTRRTLDALKRLGVTLAIDDFGTGYSSLSYLRRFPIKRLKIDGSSVREISNSEGDAALARAVIAMAHGLGVDVVAEGIETVDQLTMLRAYGCDEGQGYLLGRPVLGSEVPRVVHARVRGVPPLGLAVAAGD
jgi:EAL domain-containing protein (putative c-di-GMP-specific phosphodiesterase class I)